MSRPSMHQRIKCLKGWLKILKADQKSQDINQPKQLTVITAKGYIG